MARVFVFGGSTPYGFHDRLGGGLNGRLVATMAQRVKNDFRPAPNVVNLAVPAQSLPEVLERLPVLLDMFGARRNVAIMMVGAVDSRIRPRESTPAVPLSEFEVALGKFDAFCGERGVLPIFVGHPPVEDEFTQPWTICGGSGDTFSNEKLREYNDVVANHAARTGTPFIDTWAHFTRHCPEGGYISEDRLHLNEFGHDTLHNLVVPVIDQVLSSATSY